MAKYQINYEALDADKNKENGTPYEEFLEWVETNFRILCGYPYLYVPAQTGKR